MEATFCIGDELFGLFVLRRAYVGVRFFGMLQYVIQNVAIALVFGMIER